MRDMNYIDENGSRTPVAKMRTEDILECLKDGCEINYTDEDTSTVKDVIARLEIELIIRKNNLRETV